MKVNVLFVDPPISSKSASVEVKEFIKHKRYPIGILSIMTFLKKSIPCCDVKYLKVLDIENEKDYLQKVTSFKPDIIGFPCYSFDFFNTYLLIKKLKKLLPKSHFCCGGAHVNFYPKETLSLPEVDSVILGEGEEPFKNLCLHLSCGLPLKEQGIYTKKDIKDGKSFSYSVNADLNEMPIPDIKLLEDYLSYTSFLTGKPLGTLVSSKGCPFLCNYCSSKHSKYRLFKIEKIVETLSCYVSCGIYEFEFWDETFNPSIRRLLDFVKAMKIAKLPISFGIKGAVVQNVNYESLKGLKDVGLRRIQFGVETTSERLLNLINKRIDKQRIADAFLLCKKLKICSVANMMIGLPEQTEKDIFEDIEFLKKVQPTYIGINIFNYAPNTEFYKNYLEKKPSDDFWKHFAENPEKEVIRHCYDNITHDRLYQLQKNLTRKFYFRPSYLLKYLRTVPMDEMINSAKIGLKMLLN